MASTGAHLGRSGASESCSFSCYGSWDASNRFVRVFPFRRRARGGCRSVVVNAERAKGKGRRRAHIQSDGVQHLGSALTSFIDAPFPGPSGEKGLPLRVLPIGGLGEIGMNCMLVGVYDRFILIDAGLMFPDFQEHGMNKILPDTSFIAKWRDKIEAVVITHGHEDHIGAVPWVYPALDPNTPIFASGFVLELLKYKMKQFNLWDPHRFHCFKMRERHKVGPFEMEPIRVTHSIPDCCGLILRSDHGTIVHTGDWKIDEDPVDGLGFDREALEQVGKEGVTLLMSDSTNVLSPGRTFGEAIVRKSIADKVESWNGKGRVISTMFASNVHRLGSIKAAADAAGRKVCCVGMSLTAYLDAAHKSGHSPFDPEELINPVDLEDIDPNEVLIMTTGSQGEDFAALNVASYKRHSTLKLSPEDLLMYSAKMIPGNEKQVMKMMNRISKQGTEIAMGRGELLHTSGHGYRDELAEAIKLVKPQHFLPVHGESVFLGAHAELARELGVERTLVIHDGDMIGVKHLMRKRTLSGGSMGSLKIIGEAELNKFYNDGGKGTGTEEEMAIVERRRLATEGVIVASVNVHRPPNIQAAYESAEASGETGRGLRARVRLTSRGMWTDDGKFTKQMCAVAQEAVGQCGFDTGLPQIERFVRSKLLRATRKYNHRNPEILVVAHENDPRLANTLFSLKRRKRSSTREMDDANGKRSTSGSKRRFPNKASTRNAISDRQGLKRGSQGRRSRNFRSQRQFPATESNRIQNSTKAGDEDSQGSRGKSNQGAESAERNPRQTGNDNDEVNPGMLLGKLTPVPESDLVERRRKNPRDSPKEGVDLDYG